MCAFFSFVTNPDHDKDFYYFDWKARKSGEDGKDSHSHICAKFKLNEDKCNKWEYNPLTNKLNLVMQNAKKDDRDRVRRWLNKLDFKTIVKPLIIKPIINPLDLPEVVVPTDEQVEWLKEWDSVRASVGFSVWDSVWDSVLDAVGDSVWASVWNSVWNSVGASVRDSVRDSVWDSVRDSVRDSVWALVWAYISSFIKIDYKYDFAPAVKLWESGLVPSFDGTTWRLHTGTDARVVYEWTPDKECEDSE